MSKITKENEVLIKAKVLDHLIEHLQKRTDVHPAGYDRRHDKSPAREEGGRPY